MDKQAVLAFNRALADQPMLQGPDGKPQAPPPEPAAKAPLDFRSLVARGRAIRQTGARRAPDDHDTQ